MTDEHAGHQAGQYITSGEATLLTVTRGNGPVIVMVHGWPLDHRLFELQIPALSEHFTVIVYDRRGFGKSTGTPDMARELNDLDRIIDLLAMRSVHLLGVSQGARIALRYALARRRPLRSLLLQATPIDGVVATNDPVEHLPLAEYAAMFEQGRVDDFRRALLAHPLMDTGASPTARALMEEMVEDYRGADLAVPAAEPADIRPRLPDLRLPTLIITGATDSPTRRQHAQTLARLLPNARLEQFDNSGHLCNLTEPERYNRLVIEFCRSVDGAQQPSGMRSQH